MQCYSRSCFVAATHCRSFTFLRLCSFCRTFCFSAASCSTDSLKRIPDHDEKNKRKLLHRLHNRQLNVTQKESNDLISDLPPEDTFGLLSRKPRKQTSSDDQKEIKAAGLNQRLTSVKSNKWLARDQVDEHWADTFGTLVKDDDIAVVEEIERDEDERKRPLTGQKHSPEWYGRQIEKLGKKWKVKEAIEVLEEDMLIKDRVMPNAYVFSVLIGVLGRAGYTKKAFQLFNKMKRMGIKPDEPTYTSLFNACSNSPWSEDGLTRAHNLYSLMVKQGVQPNLINYKAMIKAFGKCGDLRKAFAVMDELCKHYRPDAESFSFLLMACISDKEAGFKHALQVWRLLKVYKMKPDLALYNLLLRVVRDCSFDKHNTGETFVLGPPEQDHEALNLPQTDSDIFTLLEDSKSDLNQRGQDLKDTREDIKEKEIGSKEGKQEQIMSEDETSGEYWWQNGSDYPDPDNQSLSSEVLKPNENKQQNSLSLNKAEHRLQLFGGCRGWLRCMDADGVKPDVKIFTQLGDILSHSDLETELLSEMEKYGVKPDIDLLNNLIHTRCMRQEFSAAKDVVQHIERCGLQPNMQTFGCLAMTCRKRTEGLELLKDMEKMNLVPNIEVLGTLIYASNMDFYYKMDILKICEELDQKPNTKFLQNTERAIAAAKAALVKVEKGYNMDDYYHSDYFQSGFEKFMLYYKPWLERTKCEIPTHPWKSFRN